MVAYSFKAKFAVNILAGTKGGTIRAERKRHARPGEELQLYIAQRTKQCRLLRRKTCIAAQPIRLTFSTLRGDEHLRGVSLFDPQTGDLVKLFTTPELRDAFARFDGFMHWDDLRSFWVKEHGNADHFDGVHIRWLDWPKALR